MLGLKSEVYNPLVTQGVFLSEGKYDALDKKSGVYLTALLCKSVYTEVNGEQNLCMSTADNSSGDATPGFIS